MYKSNLIASRVGLTSKTSRNLSLVSNLITVAGLVRNHNASHTASMDRGDVLHALETLNAELKAQGLSISVRLFGSGVIILRYDDSRRISNDLDVMFEPNDSRVRQAAEKVAQALDLPLDWFNDDVQFYNSSRLEFSSEGMPQFSNITIEALTTESLFAMKCGRGDRPQDAADVAYLARKLNLKSMEEAEDILHRFYPNRDMMTNPMMGIMSYLGLVEEQDLFSGDRFKGE